VSLSRSTATLLVAVPLALALVPLALPPWTFALVVLRIAMAELGPALAVAALLLGAVAAFMGPAPRWPFALGALAAAGLALIPTISARRAARAGVAAVDALPLAGHDGEAPLRPEVAGPNRLLGAVLGLPSPPRVTERVLQYAAADGSPLTLRVYRDTQWAHGGRPTVVVLYAGAWQNGDAAQGAPLQRWLAAHGYLVVALDYRHAPRFRHPAQLDDVRAGLALVRDSAAAWGGDPARVALLGRSSGGHLAMLAGWDSPPLPIRGVIDFYGPFDLARGYVDRPSPDPRDVRAVLRAFLGGPPDAMPDRYRDASPASLVRPGLPPALLVYGGRDHLVKPEFGRDAAAALRRSGVPVVYVELPWAEHGFDLAAGGPEGTAALGVVLRFLERVL
jgi:acetyl esterase/lipase